MTVRPMLAESIDPSALPRYARDPDWWVQLKADGHRFIIEVSEGKVEVWNRAGMPKTANVPHAVLREFDCFATGHWVFDGEIVGYRLMLFDLVVAGGIAGPQTRFDERFFTLTTLFEEWSPNPEHVVLLECARSEAEKRAMMDKARSEHREGVMLRNVAGTYQAGRRPQLIKCKFTKEADCIVTATNVNGHNNVVLSLLDPLHDRVVEVGRASANGKTPVPEVGDVWEVKFLYVVDPAAPRLYQPRLVRRRFDKDLDECLLHQLDHSFTNKDLTDDRTGVGD
jgi:ATP-dependent DNA ligase